MYSLDVLNKCAIVQLHNNNITYWQTNIFIEIIFYIVRPGQEVGVTLVTTQILYIWQTL